MQHLNIKIGFKTVASTFVLLAGLMQASHAAMLNVAFYDSTTPGADSYVIDLGISFSQLANGEIDILQTNVNSVLTADTGMNLGDLSNYSYSVFALGSINVPEFGGFPQDAIITSSNDPAFSIPDQSTLMGAYNNANAFLNAQPMNGFDSSISQSGTTSHYEAATFNGNFGGQTLSAETTVGMIMNALLPVYTGDFNDNVFNFELVDIGDFLLTSDGSFSYTTATIVPIPLSAWLFGSALISLVSFARKRA